MHTSNLKPSLRIQVTNNTLYHIWLNMFFLCRQSLTNWLMKKLTHNTNLCSRAKHTSLLSGVTKPVNVKKDEKTNEAIKTWASKIVTQVSGETRLNIRKPHEPSHKNKWYKQIQIESKTIIYEASQNAKVTWVSNCSRYMTKLIQNVFYLVLRSMTKYIFYHFPFLKSNIFLAFCSFSIYHLGCHSFEFVFDKQTNM